MDSRELRFLADVMDEVHRARKLFPTNAALMVALMEEVGELAKAMLDEGDDRVWAEAIQVAGLAMRVAIEGDSTLATVRSAMGEAKGE